MTISDLPDELLDLITDAAIRSSAPKDVYDLLKSLRRVCRRFTGLHAVYHRLFAKIRFIADHDYYIHLPEGFMHSVAPYIKHITFVPPLNARLTFRELREIFRSQAELRYGCYEPSELEGSEPTAFVGNEYLPKTGALLKGLAEINERARLSVELMRNGELGKALDCFLRLFKHCKSFHFAAVDYNRISFFDMRPIVPQCIMPEVRKYEEDFEIHCDAKKAFNIMEIFVQHVIDSMVRTKCRPERLVLDRRDFYDDSPPVASIVPGVELPNYSSWKELDAAHIRDLVVTPVPFLRQPIDDTYGYTTRRTHRLLDRCSAVLESFEYNRVHYRLWYADEFHFPNLHALHITTCSVPSARVKKWLSNMPSLKDIRIEGLLLVYDEMEGEDLQWRYERWTNWVPLITALRKHSNLTRGRIWARRTEEDTFLRLFWNKEDVTDLPFSCEMLTPDYNFDAAADEQWEMDSLDGRSDLDAWVSLYISGRASYRAFELMWLH